MLRFKLKIEQQTFNNRFAMSKKIGHNNLLHPMQ